MYILIVHCKWILYFFVKQINTIYYLIIKSIRVFTFYYTWWRFEINLLRQFVPHRYNRSWIKLGFYVGRWFVCFFLKDKNDTFTPFWTVQLKLSNFWKIAENLPPSEWNVIFLFRLPAVRYGWLHDVSAKTR